MKPSIFIPILTTAVGFGLGWFLKPVPQTPVSTTTVSPSRETPRTAPTTIEPTTQGSTDRTPSRPHLNPEKPSSVVSEIASQDESKMARLVEALNLNEEQKSAVLKAITAAQATLQPSEPIDPSKMMEIAAKAGADLEQAMLAILTPEQTTAFDALRKRSVENTVETNTQKQISKFSKLIDLSPEQRDLMLNRVREGVREEYNQRPQGLDLVLDTSPMPTGSVFVADSAIAAMPFMSGENAEANFSALREEQRKNLDGEAEKYKDILTPAQLSRLKVDIEERKKVLDRLEGIMDEKSQ